jgi:hypothetical protein
MISSTTQEDDLLYGGFIFSCLLAREDGELVEGVSFRMKDKTVSALSFEELAERIEDAFTTADGNPLRGIHAARLVDMAAELLSETEMFRLDTLCLTAPAGSEEEQNG